MSIIEKLGLLPNTRILKSEEGIAYSYETMYDCDLIAAAPEMLEALIVFYLYHQENFENDCKFKPTDCKGLEDCYECVHVKLADYSNVIEKATGKSWEEVKALCQS